MLTYTQFDNKKEAKLFDIIPSLPIIEYQVPENAEELIAEGRVYAVNDPTSLHL